MLWHVSGRIRDIAFLTVDLLPFQTGLTAVHIASKKGRRDVLSSLLEKAKTQKHFCFKRDLPSDYDVAMSAKAREVCCTVYFWKYPCNSVTLDRLILLHNSNNYDALSTKVYSDNDNGESYCASPGDIVIHMQAN